MAMLKVSQADSMRRLKEFVMLMKHIICCIVMLTAQPQERNTKKKIQFTLIIFLKSEK